MSHKLATTFPASASVRIPSEFWPLTGAFFAISFAFGVLARETGMDAWAAILMSAFVYAGTAQVVALGLLAAGQPPWLIVLVTLLINARFLLLGSVGAHRTQQWKPWERALFAWQLTDETFALLIPSSSGGLTRWRAAWLQNGAYFAWVAGTAVGFQIGADSAQLKGLGLDFALAAMMLVVLVLQIRDRVAFTVALISGLTALGAVQLGLNWFATLCAMVVAPAVGVWMEKRCNLVRF